MDLRPLLSAGSAGPAGVAREFALYASRRRLRAWPGRGAAYETGYLHPVPGVILPTVPDLAGKRKETGMERSGPTPPLSADSAGPAGVAQEFALYASRRSEINHAGSVYAVIQH